MSARVDADPRISRRRRAVERSRRRKLALQCALAGAVVITAWGVFYSPLLRVDAVRVVGATHTTTDDVVAAAGLGPEDNVLFLDVGEVARAAESLPWVRSAEVDKMLPGTVRVRVVERTPALVLALDGHRWTIDRAGRVLAPADDDGRLPVLTGVVARVAPGERVEGAAAQHALEVWRVLPRPLRRNVRAVVAPSVERITLLLADETQVRYGAAERLRAKNEVLAALLARLRAEGRRVTYVDVRVPTSPAVADAAPAGGAPGDAGAGAATRGAPVDPAPAP